jgi:hypothetical protein
MDLQNSVFVELLQRLLDGKISAYAKDIRKQITRHTYSPGYDYVFDMLHEIEMTIKYEICFDEQDEIVKRNKIKNFQCFRSFL